jgi:hypothetical protein
MKPLKILIAGCIMLGFATNAVNAQPVVISEDTKYFCQHLTCVNEMVCGDLTATRVSYGRIYKFTVNGTLIGEETGTAYRLQHADLWKTIYNEGQVHTELFTTTVHADGKLIAKVHSSFHFTINANKEMVEWKWDDLTVECK